MAFRANAFLKALSAADAALLAPLMTVTHCHSGEQLGLAGGSDALIHFPLTLVACMGTGGVSGSRGIIGREGLIGWPAILGLSPDEYPAQALFDGGTALTVPVRRMQIACFASPTLAMALLRFVQTYTVQLSHMLAHSGRATLRQRLSAWLLMVHDRIDGDTIALTHQLLASHLGVRRASVTDALHLLEGERAVRCDRRTIRIRDRWELENCAGPAYGSIEAAYRRTIGPFGKGPATPTNAGALTPVSALR